MLTGQRLRRMEANFEYYFRVYTLCFQLGLKLAMQCTGLQHIIGVSAPGCNLSQSPRLSCECTPRLCMCWQPTCRLLLTSTACWGLQMTTRGRERRAWST